MVAMTDFLHHFLMVTLCVLAAGIFGCMVRAMKGPRITDRVVAMNAVGTMVVMMICILSYLLEEAFLVDVAILYALINMVSVVVLCRVATERHHELEEERKVHHD